MWDAYERLLSTVAIALTIWSMRKPKKRKRKKRRK